MRTRILVTNGQKTIQVYWVEHTGSDIYFGLGGMVGKRTYHGSGVQHTSYGGTREKGYKGVPLKEVKGVRVLSNVSLGRLTETDFARRKSQNYSGKKSDSVIILDTRACPSGAEGHLEIGILEDNKLRDLEMRAKDHEWPHGHMVTQQIAVAAAESPWVYAIASWLFPKQANPTVGSDARKSGARGAP